MLDHVLSDGPYDLLRRLNRTGVELTTYDASARLLVRAGYAARVGKRLFLTAYGRTYRTTSRRWADYIREQYGR